MPRLVECVPNFSEGRRREVVDQILDAIAAVPGVTLLDREMDPDHNRSVLTFAGEPGPVSEAAFRAIAKAATLIDLNHHSGQHPRMGATDVVPFVPLGDTSMDVARAAADEAAERIARELGIPTYLYGDAARRPERRDLAKVREGQFEGIRDLIAKDPARAPDFGPQAVHPTAGATAVGARFFLIAFNVNLVTRDLAIAKKIAKEIRERDGGMPGVKALGFDLPEKGWAQVSMNLVDFRKTSPVAAYDAVASRAAAAGVEVAGSELVGLIPKAACPDGFPQRVRLLAWDPDQVIETRWERRKAVRS